MPTSMSRFPGLAQVQHDLFKQLESDSIKQTKQLLQSEVVYSPPIHGSVSDFEKSEDYPIFKEQFKAQLKMLVDHSKQYDSARAHEVKDSLKILSNHLFDMKDKYYGNHRVLMYTIGKQALAQICHSLKEGKLSNQELADMIYEVARGATVCADGSVTALNTVARTMLQTAGGFIASLQLAKEQMLQAKIQELTQLYFDMTPHYRGNEIHYVNGIRNAVADQFGVTEQTDFYIPHLPSIAVEAIRQILTETITPVTIAKYMAEQCLAEFHQGFLDNPGSDERVDYDLSKAESALVPLREKYGQALGIDNFLQADDFFEKCQVTKDSTLVAVKILESMQQQGLINDKLLQPEVLTGWIDPEIHQPVTVLTYGADLMWAQVQNQAECLSAKHLENSPLQKMAVNPAAEQDHRLASDIARHIITHSSLQDLKEIPPEYLLNIYNLNLFMQRMGTSQALQYLTDHIQTFTAKPTRQEMFANVMLALKIDKGTEAELVQFVGRCVAHPAKFALKQIADSEQLQALIASGKKPDAQQKQLLSRLAQLLNHGDLLSKPYEQDALEPEEHQAMLKFLQYAGKQNMLPKPEQIHPSWLPTWPDKKAFFSSLSLGKLLRYLVSHARTLLSELNAWLFKDLCNLVTTHSKFEEKEQVDDFIEFLQACYAANLDYFIDADGLIFWLDHDPMASETPSARRFSKKLHHH
ncbi:MAG: hypothetical protein ACRC5A_05340 [Enterobacteriaceae bacterium]